MIVPAYSFVATINYNDLRNYSIHGLYHWKCDEYYLIHYLRVLLLDEGLSDFSIITESKRTSTNADTFSSSMITHDFDIVSFFSEYASTKQSNVLDISFIENIFK
ncbi:hypothetical protein TetV_070 [Tetraselmis virus 1]|uniref:Uncharacterized protein n=1 Tax=Tetraselmis virus 1 TaxID=2060617 RepID=A0A2P0VMQ0_9VIRU|nr:hypothetical protein QJ968_gp070 [Tetraselmis virus 1]AUF82162.1 hypothetical protein TetV_070 [Tetraselmis virus 1]